MQPMMMDVLAQMVMYWEHHAGQPFEAAEQFTRLTFVSHLSPLLDAAR
jgi:hypothetical protein